MDPNANLEEQRRIVTAIMTAWDACDEDTGAWQDVEAVAEDGRRLAELVQSLDEWTTKGGPLPKPWNRWRT